MTGEHPAELLLAQVRACEICAADLPFGPRPVLQMHPEARILIAGQAPGRRVHESGVPFEDPSGDRLRAWMGVGPDVFYDPKLVAILPMGFCYPGTGKSGDLPPRPECAPAWRQSLLEHLADVQLTIVLGAYAQQYHLSGRYRTLTDAVRAWRDNTDHQAAQRRGKDEVFADYRIRVTEVVREYGAEHGLLDVLAVLPDAQAAGE